MVENSKKKRINNEIKIFIALFHRFIGSKCVYIAIIYIIKKTVAHLP